jgi:hypothetical protein
MRTTFVVVAALLALCGATTEVYLVPHAHCDYGWLLTPVEYYDYEVRCPFVDQQRAVQIVDVRHTVGHPINFRGFRPNPLLPWCSGRTIAIDGSV